MKKKAFFLAVFMLLMTVSFAQALPMYKVETTSGRIGIGGPFLITGSGQSFETFCIEYGEHINIPGRYYGSIDSLVYYSSGVNKDVSASIAATTATLYSYFLDNTSLTNVEEAAIQVAIWASQGQIDAPIAGTNSYYDQVIAGTLQASSRQIMALNLWISDVGQGPYNSDYDFSQRAQSMLVETPVPEPATMLLLGLGLVGIAGIRRKFKG